MIEFTLNDEPINFTLNVELEEDIPIPPEEGIYDFTYDYTYE